MDTLHTVMALVAEARAADGLSREIAPGTRLLARLLAETARGLCQDFAGALGDGRAECRRVAFFEASGFLLFVLDLEAFGSDQVEDAKADLFDWCGRITWELCARPCDMSTYRKAVTARVGAYADLLQDERKKFYAAFAKLSCSHPLFGRMFTAMARQGFSAEDPGLFESLLEAMAKGAPMIGATNAVMLRDSFFDRVLPFQFAVRRALAGKYDYRTVSAHQLGAAIRQGLEEGERQAARIVGEEREDGG